MAKSEEIAGHKFEDGPGGCRCVRFKPFSTERCNVAWVDIASATQADVGTPGWSHTGVLGLSDLWEIQEKVDKIWLADQRRS